MATNKHSFTFDRTPDLGVLEKGLDQELSLRWQFVQAKDGKSLPTVLFPQLSRPPKPPKQQPDDDFTIPIWLIIRQLQDLHLNGGLSLDGRTLPQERLARTLGERWHFWHTLKSEPILESITVEEIRELKRLIGDRYGWFLGLEQTTRGKIKSAAVSVTELEVSMTRQHNAVSKEYKSWLKAIENHPAVVRLPFDRTPDVNPDSGWHAWFRLEEQLLKAKLELEMQQRAQSWVFRDILAAMANGLIENGEM